MAKSKAPTHQTNGYQLHIPALVQAFSYVENDGLNLAKLLTRMTVASNSIILTTIRDGA